MTADSKQYISESLLNCYYDNEAEPEYQTEEIKSISREYCLEYLELRKKYIERIKDQLA